MSVQNKGIYILFLVLFGGLGGMLYGYDVGVISGALLFMNKDIALTTQQTSLITGAVLGGGAFATLITGKIADIIGRKKTIIISIIIFIIGVFWLLNAHTYIHALNARLLQGIGIGMQIIVLPLYLAESTPSEIRGRSVTLFQLFLTSGILLAYIINIVFASSENWQGMFACALIPAFILLGASFFIIESPRWMYVKHGKTSALNLLHRTRNTEQAQHDVAQLEKMHLAADHSIIFLKNIIKKENLRPFLIAFGIACLNQLTGINSFLQYGAVILKNTGISSNLVALLGTAGIGTVNLLTTIVAILLIDKVGRKPLLMFGTLGIVVSMVFLGLVNYFVPNSALLGYLVIAGLLAFILTYAIGPGVVVWLALSELLPTSIRSTGMAVCLFANSAVSAIFASTFLVLAEKIHIYGVFFFCAAFTFCYFLIAKIALPETKQKSLEEIEEHFYKR